MTKLFFSILLLLFTCSSFAQNSVPEKIVEALDSFSFLRPQEKTYVQTDRNDYLAGESIWFKTYAQLNQKPTVLSKVIYVDLVDPSGKITEKKMEKNEKTQIIGYSRFITSMEERIHSPSTSHKPMNGTFKDKK